MSDQVPPWNGFMDKIEDLNMWPPSMWEKREEEDSWRAERPKPLDSEVPYPPPPRPNLMPMVFRLQDARWKLASAYLHPQGPLCKVVPQPGRSAVPQLLHPSGARVPPSLTDRFPSPLLPKHNISASVGHTQRSAFPWRYLSHSSRAAQRLHLWAFHSICP